MSSAESLRFLTPFVTRSRPLSSSSPLPSSRPLPSSLSPKYDARLYLQDVLRVELGLFIGIALGLLLGLDSRLALLALLGSGFSVAFLFLVEAAAGRRRGARGSALATLKGTQHTHTRTSLCSLRAWT